MSDHTGPQVISTDDGEEVFESSDEGARDSSEFDEEDHFDSSDEEESVVARCPVCLDMKQPNRRKQKSTYIPGWDVIGWGVWVDAHAIRSSAQGPQGCHVCALIRDATETLLSNCWPEYERNSDYAIFLAEMSYPGPGARGEGTLKLVVHWNPGPGRRSSRRHVSGRYENSNMVEVEIYYTDETEHDTASRYPRLRLGHEVEARLTAREYAKKIEGWIAKCQATHVACRTESARLPRRVLDLSCDQIVLVDGQDKAAPYVALSHCWRTDRPCITNHANLGDRMRGINQNELTHVFQDAVQITRALGIRYLWIDALCIIQDSVQDWEQQSAVMADIYSGSYLNISATRSSSGHESFLDARWNLHDKIEDRPGWPLKHQVQSFPVVPGVSADGPRYPSSLKVRKPFRLSHQITDKRFSEASQAVAPLCQRAWVYQEKMLSPRTVHFHANEMVWECAEKGFCECGYLDMVTHLRIFKHFITNLSSLSRKDPLEPHSIWRMIVERYYKLSLTYEADRLPALAGLAARFAQHLPEHADHMYLAGLWRDTLAIDLLWYLKSPGTRLRLPHGPPSWSWASLRGSWLTFRWYPCISKHVGNVHRCDHRFSIISASVQGNQNSIYGAVSGGLIVVSGILCAISVHDEPRPWPHWLPPLAAQAPKNSFANLSLKFDDESDKAEVHGPNSTTCGFLFCLFVGTCHDDGPDGQTYSTVHDGLILRPFRTPNLTLFRRIGFWSQLNHGRDNYTEFFTERGETLTIRIV